MGGLLYCAPLAVLIRKAFMWFKNVQIFRLVEPFKLSPEALEDYLLNDATRPCGQLEMSTYGWVPPLGLQHQALTHPSNGCILLAAKRQDKLLPTAVVREQVQEQIAQIERDQGRKVGSRERRGMMDETTIKLMPKALVKSSTVYGYIDLQQQCLVIDSASRAKAEEFIILLRKSLGSLKVVPVTLKKNVAQVLTKWLLHDDVPTDFTIDDQCELRDPEHEKNIVRVVNQSLYSQEVLNHLTAGKQVIKLALTWADRVSFVLDHEFGIKRVRLLELVQEQLNDVEFATPEDQFDADFAIFSAELSGLIPRLYEAFGGLSDVAAIAAAPVKQELEAMA